ncbi:MAG: hypothetical protein H0T54_01910, partial [Geodermatophilaceae bacterium]|nr:hypothetical protein [Geodermatophilaceae bacterium]
MDRQAVSTPTVLEPTPDQIRAIMAEVSDFAGAVLEGIPTSRASTSDGAEALAHSLAEDFPSKATLTELLEVLSASSAKGFNQLHPGFLGYVPPTGMPIGAVADFLGAL